MTKAWKVHDALIKVLVNILIELAIASKLNYKPSRGRRPGDTRVAIANWPWLAIPIRARGRPILKSAAGT